jgi:DNA repair exonuclease SbcCD ATPase subunit
LATPQISDDPELKAAQLSKLLAETDKLKAEKAKLEQEAAAVPRQTKGSYWSEVIKILGAIVLGVGGVVTAGGSYFVARNQVELAEIKSVQATERTKAAVAAASAATVDAESAVKLRDSARKEQTEAEKSVRELRDTLAELNRKVQASKPELVKRRLVYVQFQGGLDRPLINDLRTSLETANYSAPGAERIAGEYRSVIKYFRDEDETEATALLKVTEAFFASRGCPIQLRTSQAKGSSTAPPFEVWLSHSCKG